MDELDKLLNGETDSEPTAPEPEAQTQEKTDPEVEAKRQKLENLNKAIAESESKLKSLRQQRRQPVEEDEEDVPKIDFQDPASKAWRKHISDNVSPLQAELEKEREEVRTFALRDFLRDKPHLARNKEKLSELMETYERIHTASERTKEGVLLDLQKAYAATFHEELMSTVRESRVDQAASDMLYSDPAVSRGATAYEAPKERVKKFSKEELEVLAQWGYSPAEAAEDHAKYGK